MVSLLKVCSGGLGTRGAILIGYGNGVGPPSLNASSREGPCFDSGVVIVLAGPKIRDAEPHPTATTTYCCPPALKLTGVASIADPVLIAQSFFPLSAAYTLNSPLPSP